MDFPKVTKTIRLDEQKVRTFQEQLPSGFDDTHLELADSLFLAGVICWNALKDIGEDGRSTHYLNIIKDTKEALAKLLRDDQPRDGKISASDLYHFKIPDTVGAILCRAVQRQVVPAGTIPTEHEALLAKTLEAMFERCVDFAMLVQTNQLTKIECKTISARDGRADPLR